MGYQKLFKIKTFSGLTGKLVVKKLFSTEGIPSNWHHHRGGSISGNHHPNFSSCQHNHKDPLIWNGEYQLDYMGKGGLSNGPKIKGLCGQTLPECAVPACPGPGILWSCGRPQRALGAVVRNFQSFPGKCHSCCGRSSQAPDLAHSWSLEPAALEHHNYHKQKKDNGQHRDVLN